MPDLSSLQENSSEFNPDTFRNELMSIITKRYKYKKGAIWTKKKGDMGNVAYVPEQVQPCFKYIVATLKKYPNCAVEILQVVEDFIYQCKGIENSTVKDFTDRDALYSYFYMAQTMQRLLTEVIISLLNDGVSLRQIWKMQEDVRNKVRKTTRES